jgi:hypothetical protein
MQVHGLIAFLATLLINEARALSLDLDFTARVLLDVLHVLTTTADNLCSQIESTDNFEAHVDLLLGPFALFLVSGLMQAGQSKSSALLTLPNSSRSKFSGSRRRKRRSSTRLGKSSFIKSSIILVALSRPSLEVLVTRR